MKNDVVSSVRFTAEQDSIRYDASPPNSSELKEEFICYDANLDSYISPNPESYQCSLCPSKYWVRSSIIEHNNSAHNDLDEKFVILVKGQEVIGDNYKILLLLIYLAYHYVKTNKDF